MKHIITLLFAMLFAFPALAAPELTPAQKLKVAFVGAEAATALVVGPVFLPAAILTGQREGLCNLMGGTYTPNSDGKDQCPGGLWLRTIPYIKDVVIER